ncbi:TetR/AcrR family transcriptional regulator [Mycobacterium sp.]|uniref:TetR/AcrR family transcriptional regulator n=1 Tax=Mycobacterium sp. TaxID=1785 RepID=UPI002D491C1A|nr:TetR/AcrR family transcriptional regulator [Mycobacterium sp.]HZA08587.1 TetR/AcrR family transcriptional regulator [Mycobacterium sp.]
MLAVHDTARTARVSTKTKMLISASEVLRERGAAGLTIDDVLSRSGAPRGSVYHHFPAGRNQILAEALRYAGDTITAKIEAAADKGGMELLHQFVEFWEQLLRDTDFTAGCPVVAAAIGSAPDEQQLTTTAGEIFRGWREALTRSFVSEGFPAREASSLATTSIAAVEGAVVLCRATRTTEPLREVAEQIEFLVRAREFVTRRS